MVRPIARTATSRPRCPAVRQAPQERAATSDQCPHCARRVYSDRGPVSTRTGVRFLLLAVLSGRGHHRTASADPAARTRPPRVSTADTRAVRTVDGLDSANGRCPRAADSVDTARARRTSAHPLPLPCGHRAGPCDVWGGQQPGPWTPAWTPSGHPGRGCPDGPAWVGATGSSRPVGGRWWGAASASKPAAPDRQAGPAAAHARPSSRVTQARGPPRTTGPRTQALGPRQPASRRSPRRCAALATQTATTSREPGRRWPPQAHHRARSAPRPGPHPGGGGPRWTALIAPSSRRSRALGQGPAHRWASASRELQLLSVVRPGGHLKRAPGPRAQNPRDSKHHRNMLRPRRPRRLPLAIDL
jgi:hypothetical protein